MTQDGVSSSKHTVAVIAMVQEWSSLTSLLQKGSGDNIYQTTFSSLGSEKQVCDLTMEGHFIRLHYEDLKEDMSDEAICQTIDGCFKACKGGVSAFLLLIQGGYYTKSEQRIVEILQSHFGAEALKYLVILSVEDGKVIDTLDDSLLDLINVCEGRYCRITSSTASGGLQALLEMVNNVLTENSEAGYTEAMLDESKRRSMEDSAMNMLRQKMQEAEEKEQAFMELVKEKEERRAKEMEDLKTKHEEERKKEAEDKRKHEAKRESLHEAVISHRSMLQLQAKAPDGDETKKTSVVLLGLTGSGKSSALNLILNRSGNTYSLNSSCQDPTESTICCERKEIFTGGKRLILVDTPELWDDDGVENTELVKDCLALALPGPHVFLLVLQVGRFTQCESEMLGHVQKIFGREVVEHAIILFVHFDSNKHRPLKINEYVAGAHSSLQDLIRKCGSRFYLLNVSKSHSGLSYPQVKELLSGVDKLVASHGGRGYSVKRFSSQELQERNHLTGDRKEAAYLLGDN
ncbi:GTPase IMAP family member 8 [Fundulus heteroclitus]|uniref:GTPase IMAP family member 8 n=1 Tax=Fundulus heteroclitus TaxID=8078 RepID=UPI00165C0A08|nr:GTPase IMAP family member 8 [Fundulus heteroclitus]